MYYMAPLALDRVLKSNAMAKDFYSKSGKNHGFQYQDDSESDTVTGTSLLFPRIGGHEAVSCDQLIADALNQLSCRERDDVYQQIHGVADVIEESPDFVSQKLLELHGEIDRITTAASSTGDALPVQAYLLARSQNPAFVTERKLCLKFLRVARFNVRKAATRMIRYFDWKLSLFGQEKLCKHITYDDLRMEDIKDLRKGFIQRLPERDRAGRAVYFIFGCDHIFHSPESYVSAFSFLLDLSCRIFFLCCTDFYYLFSAFVVAMLKPFLFSCYNS